MRKTCLLIMLLTVLFPAVAFAENVGNIGVRVVGLHNDNGVVRIALFNSKQSYNADKDDSGSTAFSRGAAEIKSGLAEYVFKEVPYGIYAIKMFHDEDNSGKFKANFLGIPKVEYGFSNNPSGRLGPASYENAKFKLRSPDLSMEIKAQKAL